MTNFPIAPIRPPSHPGQPMEGLSERAKKESRIEQAQQFLRTFEAITPEARKAFGALLNVAAKEDSKRGQRIS